MGQREPKCFFNQTYKDSNIPGLQPDADHYFNCALTDVSFTGNHCGVSFAGSGLTRVNFKDCDLTGANFSGATFDEVCFDRAKLIKACFTRAKFGNTSFVQANLEEADISHARMLEGSEGLVSVYFTNAKAKSSVFAYARLSGDFRFADFSYSCFSHGMFGGDFTGANLHGCSFADAHLRGNMVGCNMAHSSLINARCMGVDFSYASLEYAVCCLTSFGGAIFSHTELRGATFDLRDDQKRISGVFRVNSDADVSLANSLTVY